MALEDILLYKFQQQELVHLAFTHASNGGKNNERLEFLGDRVLGLVISEYLFQQFPKINEGILSLRLNSLVSRQFLSQIAQEIGLREYYKLHPSLEHNIVPSVHANMVESVIGAMYLDGGYDVCKNFILHYWHDYLNLEESGQKPIRNLLQEKCQQNGHEVPVYHLLDKIGPDHDCDFIVIVECFYGSEKGTGKTKNLAISNAAQKLWEKING